MSIKISIYGAVQGVGFRPFIYKLATNLGLKGEVYNDSEGVKILLNHTNEKVFIDEIYKNLPTLAPLARIDRIEISKVDTKIYDDFSITNSKITTKFNPILPDYAICDDCKKEFYDKDNFRYHYAFINCTNCGPRLSIIKDLPYDRKNTTMNEFKMCQTCLDEYTDPSNRRFHAEPVSCPSCGPTLFLKDKNGNILSKDKDAIKDSSNLLSDGKILAIKGLGGFHLVCDALNFKTIDELRMRKNRPSKPFAMMVKDIDMAREYGEISSSEAKFLSSKVAPILLVKSKDKVAKNLAFNTNKIGLFIAPTGLHLLLFEFIKHPLIATSANLSGEAIIFDESTLLKKLGGVFDYYLDNNRDIITPSDDSVAFCVEDKLHYLRTSRGINPIIYLSEFRQKGTFLALGAEMKNQFAIYKDGQIFISPYIGDLKNSVNFDRFLHILDMFIRNYDFKFDAVIGDLHPDFIHTKHFENLGYKVEKIQHHYAHLLSNLYENKLCDKEYLGISFDGTGYGNDAKIWGGEIFKFDYKSYERLYHFDEFLLLGGQKSIKEISRLTYAIFKKYGFDTSILNLKQENELNYIYDKEINSFYTSSLGRLFDAFCSYKFDLDSVSYDGQAGLLIEKFYNPKLKKAYKFKLEKGIISYKDAFLEALGDDKVEASSKFINALINLIIEVAKEQNLDVVLSGGVFQNQTLVENLVKRFKKESITYYFNHEIPTNDSGVCLGQLVWYLKNGVKNG